MEIRKALTRQEVRNVIDFKGCDHVPVMYHFWCGPRGDATQEWRDRVVAVRDRFPNDVTVFGVGGPGVWDAPADAPRQRWAHRGRPAAAESGKGLDSGSKMIVDLAAEIDHIVEVFPEADYPPFYAGLAKAVADNTSGCYRLGCAWFCFFERLWSMMGMEETLVNFYTCPDAMHRLIRAVCDFHKGQIRNAAAQASLDGWFTSDDIGQQTGTFFSVEIFNEFFKPYYKELVDEAHRHGMHYWLHTCGNVEAFMPGFVEIGLDVIHPIQKYTMDERNMAREWGGKICFWAGFDVQQTLPYGTAEDVRREVRFMIDTYGRPDGGLMLTAGNGVTPDNPPENIEALFEESFAYGTDYRKHLKAAR
jgi:hypothetical protein